MGCCSSMMLVKSFPVQLPKLCVHTVLEFPIDDSLSSVELVLKQNNVEVAKFDLDTASKKPDGDHVSIPLRPNLLTGGLTLSPLDISEETILEVLAYVDGETISGGQLFIRQEVSS